MLTLRRYLRTLIAIGLVIVAFCLAVLIASVLSSRQVRAAVGWPVL